MSSQYFDFTPFLQAIMYLYTPTYKVQHTSGLQVDYRTSGPHYLIAKLFYTYTFIAFVYCT